MQSDIAVALNVPSTGHEFSESFLALLVADAYGETDSQRNDALTLAQLEVC